CSRLQILVHCLLTPPSNLLIVCHGLIHDNIRETWQLKEMHCVVLQWMFLSTSSIWFITDLVGRSSWKSKEFRLQNIIKMFENLKYRNDYFDLFIDALSTLTINSDDNVYKKEPITSKQALYLYQMFSILSVLLTNSTQYETYFRERYLEEFTYFLKEELILSKIAIQYPVYRFLPKLIKNVIHRIMYGAMNATNLESQLEAWCQQNSVIPDDDDKPWVLKYHIEYEDEIDDGDDDGNKFRFCVILCDSLEGH
ncbi:unnamed protein product, partial [Didymodactylos carnosus]